MSLVTAPDTPFQELARLVRSDVAFATRVLRLANSPLIGGREVTSILHALSILGSDRLNALVMTLAIHQFVSRPGRQHDLTHRCWRHSVATAYLCELLAVSFGQHPDTAYTAGLLHDMGAIAIAFLYPVQYEEILQRCTDTGQQLAAEQDQFGVDHAEFGAELVDLWQMPSHFCRLLLEHHSYQDSGHSLQGLVQRCDALANQLGLSIFASGSFGQDPEHLPAWLPARWRSLDLLAHLLERINGLECSLM